MHSLFKKTIGLAMAGIISAGMLTGCGTTATDTSVEDIVARGVVKVVIPNYDTELLYYSDEDQDYRGKEAEIIDVISQSLQVPVEYVRADKSAMLNMLDLGTADLAIGYIDENSDLLANYGKTTSYGGEDLYVVSPRGVYVGNIDVLEGTDVGVSSLIDSAAYGSVYYSGVSSVVVYGDSESVINAFETDKIDGYICYKSEALYLTNTGEFQVQSVSELDRENFVIATLSGNTKLLAGCNSLIQSYLTGEYKARWAQTDN